MQRYKNILCVVNPRENASLVVRRASDHNIAVDPTSFLPADGDGFTYLGSLSTPPRSEGVRRIVRTEPATLSRAQVIAYADLLGNTAGPVQPTYDRKVELSID